MQERVKERPERYREARGRGGGEREREREKGPRILGRPFILVEMFLNVNTSRNSSQVSGILMFFARKMSFR